MSLKNPLIVTGTCLAILFGSGLPVKAASISDCDDECTLQDGNATAKIDATSSDGMYSWEVDGEDHLYQQWFWYRVGDSGPEASIDTLTLDIAGLSDTNYDGDDDTLFLRYLGTGFNIDVKYSLQGGALGSHGADIAEQIKITNTGSSSLNFHIFQYSDFDLSDDADGQTVTILNGNTARQTGSETVLSETVVTPMASHFEAAEYSDLLDSLEDGSPTTLSDIASFGPGDATWAFQWDVVIGAGSSFQISKDKQIAPVPEPSTVFLLGSGLAGLAWWRHRKAHTVE